MRGGAAGLLRDGLGPPGVLWGHQGCYGATKDAYGVPKGCVGMMGGAAGLLRDGLGPPGMPMESLRDGLGPPGLLWGH